MKVLYLTVPSFFDLEISLIRELKKLVDIKVVMIVSPESMHSSAFSIDKLDERCAIIPATQYNGMEQYKDMLNLEDWFIANNPDNSLGHGISLARKIHKFYKERGFTLLHSTTDCKTAIMHMPYALLNKNTLYTEHDPIPHVNKGRLYELVRYRLMFKCFKNLQFYSDALLKPFCEKFGYNKELIGFSRLSVYDFLTTYKDCRNQYGDYILFFGRISPYKGVDNLIEAYNKSEACHNGVKLVIAGKGSIEHDAQSLGEKIIFLNRYIDNDELANLVRHCKYVVLPYISATQSGCVMSAFAFNKPILATNVGDLPKVVMEGVTGSLCKPNDIESLCCAINKMEHTDLNSLSNRIADLYQEGGELSWQKSAQMMVGIYNSIIC